MNAKLITPILALCCLPLSAKVYTVQSLLGDMVVNINVDKSITWDITKGKTLVFNLPLSPYKLINRSLA